MFGAQDVTLCSLKTRKKKKEERISEIHQEKLKEGTIRRDSNRTLEGGGKMELKLVEEEGSLGPKS